MNPVVSPAVAWEWRRVGAWSGSLAAHAAALLLLAAPLRHPAADPARPPPTEVVLREPPPPAVPEPPPPSPPRPQRAKPQAAPRPLPAPPPPPSPAPASAAATARSPGPAPAAPAPAAAATPLPAAPAANGPTRRLAYAGALRTRYPPASLRAREQGTVVLRVLVGADGLPRRIEVERSSGHRALDDAAREAVGKGRFEPVIENGRAVEGWGLVPIEFRLGRA